jgi:hypothetical protein
MGYLMKRHLHDFEPQPLAGTFALFATMVLAGVVIVFLGWLLAQ